MPEFDIRPAVAADLPGIQETQYEAWADMHRRFGLPVPPPAQAPVPIFAHVLAHHGGGGFWVAEAGGRVVAFANGLLREDNWFLSNFWCRPGWQGKGIGSGLAARLRAAMARARAWSVYASYDPPAMATYLGLGLWPRAPFFRFTPRKGMALSAPPPWRGEVRDLSAPADADLAALAELDRQVRGCRRDPEHRFFGSLPGSQVRLYYRRDRLVAYGWVHDGSRIGPIACARAADVPPVLHAAVALGWDLAGPRAALDIPGENTGALQWCLASGLRLTSHQLGFRRPAFGRFDRYVIAHPMLL